MCVVKGEGEIAESTEKPGAEGESSETEGTQEVWKEGKFMTFTIISQRCQIWYYAVLQVQQDILQKRREERNNSMKAFKKGNARLQNVT